MVIVLRPTNEFEKEIKGITRCDMIEWNDVKYFLTSLLLIERFPRTLNDCVYNAWIYRLLSITI